MAHFLRDERLENLTITEDSLNQIHQVFETQSLTIPEAANPQPSQTQSFYLMYIIRFDNKGYRMFSFDQLLQYFRQANYVERILFTLESDVSIRTNRNVGSHLELRLDEKDPNLCIVSVTSDNGGWVDKTFCAMDEILSRCKNRKMVGSEIFGSIW